MIYFFGSTRKADKVTQITVISQNVVAAHIAANRYFKRVGYRGTPKLLAV